jgi:hypothetical protein
VPRRTLRPLGRGLIVDERGVIIAQATFGADQGSAFFADWQQSLTNQVIYLGLAFLDPPADCLGASYEVIAAILDRLAFTHIATLLLLSSVSLLYEFRFAITSEAILQMDYLK